MTQIEAMTILYEATVERDDDLMINKARRVVSRRINSFRARYQKMSKDVLDENEEWILTIKGLCSKRFRVPLITIDGPERTAQACQCRHSAIWLCCKAGFSHPLVAANFGGLSPSTTEHAVNGVEDRISWDHAYRAIMRWLAHETEEIIGMSFEPKLKERLARVGV